MVSVQSRRAVLAKWRPENTRGSSALAVREAPSRGAKAVRSPADRLPDLQTPGSDQGPGW